MFGLFEKKKHLVIENRQEIKKKVLSFLEAEVNKFLLENTEEIFYGLAIAPSGNDMCDIFLYFSTEEYFEQLLEKEDLEELHEDYGKNAIFLFKYSVGDWKYDAFAALEVIPAEEWRTLTDEDEERLRGTDGRCTCKACSYYEAMTDLYCEALIDFSQTETYKKIPKTADFRLVCTDGDEDAEKDLKRFKRIEKAYK